MRRPGTRVVVFAPNWLGDAVMAVPCLETLKRGEGERTLAVAARRHLAPLYRMVDGVSEVIELRPVGRLGGVASAFADARRLSAGRFDLAVLLPNSFRSALIARLAGIPARRGYAADGRRWLLTQAVPRIGGVHMVEYYRHLATNQSGSGFRPGAINQSGSGFRPGSEFRPHFIVPAGAQDRVRGLLAECGWAAGAPLVGMAPGAAYGTAKQWLPERFAQLAAELADAGVRTVLVGSAADRDVCERIARAAPTGVINLAGRTSLAELAAVIGECGSFVTNDSGAMHVAVAAGVPVTALFGPTQEWETGPDYPPGEVGESESPSVRKSGTVLIIGDVPCRPCMLRECPIEHQCMTAITVERVKAAVLGQLATRTVR